MTMKEMMKPMTMKEIKQMMKQGYEAWDKNGDSSYLELYHALYTFRNAGLMTEKQWKEISKYDTELFEMYK